MNHRTDPRVLIAAALIVAAPAFSDTVFRDPNGQFSVTVPDDWTARSWSLGVMFEHGKTLMNLLTHSERIEPEIMARVQVKLAVEGWKDVRSSGASAGTIAGNPAATMVVLGNTASGASLYRFTCFNLGQKTYIFRTKAPPQDYPALQSVIERIEQSFRVGTAQPAAPPPAAKKAAPAPEPASVMTPALPQPAGGDQLVRAKGGEYTLRLPAAWKIMVNVNGVEAGGDRVRMKLYFVEMVASLRNSIGGIVQASTESWKNVTSERDDKTTIGGNRAEVSIIRGVNEDGVRAVRRAALVNPLPPDPKSHTYAFLFDVAESDYARSLPLIQRIEQSFRAGSAQPAAPPPAAKKAAPAPGPALVMPPELPDPEPAGAAASTYRDPQGRFQIPVPPGWTADKAGDGARVSRGSSYANVLVADGAASPSALLQQIAQQVGTQWKDFRMVQNGQWNLGGLPAEFGVYTGTNPRGAPALLRVVASSGFVLLMSVPQSDWEAFKTDLRQIESGFSTGRAPAGRASLGVACRDVNSGDMWASGGATKQGAVIGEIGPGSPAQQAGFRIGDTIISVDRQEVKGGTDLARLVAAHKPGDTVEVVVLRGGRPLEFRVTLAGRP